MWKAKNHLSDYVMKRTLWLQWPFKSAKCLLTNKHLSPSLSRLFSSHHSHLFICLECTTPVLTVPLLNARYCMLSNTSSAFTIVRLDILAVVRLRGKLAERIRYMLGVGKEYWLLPRSCAAPRPDVMWLCIPHGGNVSGPKVRPRLSAPAEIRHNLVWVTTQTCALILSR